MAMVSSWHDPVGETDTPQVIDAGGASFCSVESERPQRATVAIADRVTSSSWLVTCPRQRSSFGHCCLSDLGV